MKEEKTCSGCGVMYDESQLVHFDDALLCRTCLNLETVDCSHCGRRVWNDDNYGNDGMPLCEHCYDEHYTTCSCCERIIHSDDVYYEDDDDDPYCFNCYNRYVTTRIVFTLSKVIIRCVFITSPKSEYTSMLQRKIYSKRL